jgi:hypothetical protein
MLDGIPAALGVDLFGVGSFELVNALVALLLGLLVELLAVLFEDGLRWLCGCEEADVVNLSPSALVDGLCRA